MPDKGLWLAAGATGLVVAAAYFGWPDLPAPSAGQAGWAAVPAGTPALAGATTATAGALAEALPAGVDEAALIEQWRAKFGPHIGSKHAQIKLIEQLIRYLSERYPDDWRARLRGMLQRLFPELAEALYARFEKLEGHNRWLAENRQALNRMTAAQRRDALWAARYEAFGADAEEIWAGTRRSEQLQDTLAALDAANGESAVQKMDHFVAAIEQAYGEQAPQFIGMRQTELLGNFLGLDAVQSELRALAPAQRREVLRELRQTLGMDAAALTRWEELDRSRDAAWDAGQRYLSQRAAILAVGAPEQQARQLEQLRAELFGPEEAAIIAAEEAAGFHRFAHERRIGRE